MGETAEGEGLDLRWLQDGLVILDGRYRRSGSAYVFLASRPPGPWHAHGTTPRRLLTVIGGRPVRVLIHKPRWKHARTGVTMHSRPRDEVWGSSACTLVLMLTLWAWLSSPSGLHRVRSPLHDVTSSRTVQRWFRRALALAPATEHAFRFEAIEISEPRPLESLFDSGLSPPALSRWRSPSSVQRLHRAFAYIIHGSRVFQRCAARLLAGARGRWIGPESQFVV